MRDELQELIEAQLRDQRQGRFQRPEEGVIHLGQIAGFIDEFGHTVTTSNFGRRLGDKRTRRTSSVKGRYRTCTHGDTYRKQKYDKDGNKNGTRCMECARIYAANWRAGVGLDRPKSGPS